MVTLTKYKIAVKLYIQFLNKNKYPTTLLFSKGSTLQMSLGYILEFLETRNVYLDVTPRYYSITESCYRGTNQQPHKEIYKVPNPIMVNYMIAINEAFRILDLPF